MDREQLYSASVSTEHLRTLGQFFTPPEVAEFMVKWVCRDAETFLDPAAGNSIFLKSAKKLCPACALTGYEIDETILKYFGNPAGAHLICGDYLTSGWDQCYDAIVCNPPYHRFQSVARRQTLLEEIFRHTGKRYSSYTNLYILFLLKSIFQLSARGRLAYLVPSEFLNSKYGIPVKALLLEQHLLHSVINFEENARVFPGANTTCCILLLDRAAKNRVFFYNLPSADGLKSLTPGGEKWLSSEVLAADLKPEQNWRPLVMGLRPVPLTGFRPVSDFCHIVRGIATGANDYFCLTAGELEQYHIPHACVRPCVCHSGDISSPVFRQEDFDHLAEQGKKVYLLDVRDPEMARVYLQRGRVLGIPQKYLPAHRNPWFAMEQRAPAPIWVSAAFRSSVKFVRNLAGVSALTTFHAVYVRDFAMTDLVFAYFLTPAAQEILCRNQKELGRGLRRFQPGDLNSAQMLDLTLLSPADRTAAREICRELYRCPSRQTDALSRIFGPYIKK